MNQGDLIRLQGKQLGFPLESCRHFWYSGLGGSPMLGTYVFLDDDIQDPIYAEPPLEDLDDDGEAVKEVVAESVDGDLAVRGVQATEDGHVAWQHKSRTGLTFVAITTECGGSALQRYLSEVIRAYEDEVDDVRNPDRDGVVDVILSVEPPEEEEITDI